MSYSLKELVGTFEQEGINCPYEDRKKEAFNLFPENANYGTFLGKLEEKAIRLFLSCYENRKYACFYIDPTFEVGDRVADLTEALIELDTPLTFRSDTFFYKVIAGAYSSPILFRYEVEGGEPIIGILIPTL